MRNEKEMFELILNFAEADDRIRGVILNGSRTNPNISNDIFQDQDIVYLVTEVEPFTVEDAIVPHFGEIMLMQKPEDKLLPPPVGDGRYTYLMQFTDGNRIDLHIAHISRIDDYIQDSLTEVLLDKDGIIPDLPPASEESHRITKPTEKLYHDFCDSFIWGLGSHIPKTIWRKELPLLMTLMDLVLRKPLIQMLEWHIGAQMDYQRSAGKGAKLLQRYLEPEMWAVFEKTYSDANYDNIWNALFALHDLFKETALKVGQRYDFSYPDEEINRALKFLKHVKELPADAESIF